MGVVAKRKKIKGGVKAPSLRSMDVHLERIILCLMDLESNFKKCGELFCNPEHLRDTLKAVRELRYTYEDLQYYYGTLKDKK